MQVFPYALSSFNYRSQFSQNFAHTYTARIEVNLDKHFQT
jgi:hypothetical protein